MLDLDIKNRELIQTKEKYEQEKKIISQKKDKSLFKKSKEVSFEIEKLTKNQKKINDELTAHLSSLPNISLDDVPIGNDANANKEISKFGKISEFDFTPQSHDQIGKTLGQMDFDLATKTSGARFVFLKR